jgi:serine/threonine protein kinase
VTPPLFSQVGSGGFAEVFRASWQRSGKDVQVAVKQLRVLPEEAQTAQQFFKEIGLMQHLQACAAPSPAPPPPSTHRLPLARVLPERCRLPIRSTRTCSRSSASASPSTARWES